MLNRNFECTVLEAENGQIGLNILLTSIPDLILLDISMPVLDGFKTLEIIRENQILKKIPVIVITALSDGKVVSNLAEKGICDYILKPIDINESVKRIQRVIDKTIAHNGKEISKVEEHLLIIDQDKQFKSFFKSLFDNQFIIHEASKGIDGFDIYSQYKPKYIFVSDRLSLLDKKIITQKIKELVSDHDISIYLLVDDLTKLSTKVFNYDGYIKRTLDKTLFLENNIFLKNILPKMQDAGK